MDQPKIIREGSAYNFVYGDVKFPVDKESLSNSVNLVDSLNAAVKVQILLNAGLPADPYNEKLSKPVIMGIIQNIWYETFEDSVPETCIRNHERRIVKYKKDIETLRANPEAASEKPGRARRESSGGNNGTGRTRSSGVQLYRLTAAGREAKLKGQQGVIQEFLKQDAFKSNGAQASVIASGIDQQIQSAGAKQPTERVVAFYMNDWRKRNLLEVVGEQSTIPASETMTTAEQAAAGDTSKVEALAEEIKQPEEPPKKKAAKKKK